MQNTLKDTHKYLRVRCIEWSVQPPYTGNHRIKSDTFSFQNDNCSLQFYTGKIHQHHPSLTFKYYGSNIQLPISFTLRVVLNFKTDCQKVVSVKINDQEIWEYKESFTLPEDPLTFQLIFHPHSSNGHRYRKALSNITEIVSMRSLSEDFSKLLETELDHDVVMKCGESSIKAHKLVLSARSDVFRAMLQSDMLEARTGVIEIQEMDVNYFPEFTRYLYTDEMPEMSFEKAKGLYEAGDKYNIRSLVLQCAAYLGETLCPENVFECYTFANHHSDENLKEVVEAYLLEKKVYLQSEHWDPFCKNFPEVALEIYGLSHETNSPKRRKVL